MNNKIEIYTSVDHKVHVVVKVADDTVWTTFAEIATLYSRDQATIKEHIGNLTRNGEFDYSTSRKFPLVAGNGKTYDTLHFNLDVIIAVGYKVHSPEGIAFRKRATEYLKSVMTKGYAIDERAVVVELEQEKL